MPANTARPPIPNKRPSCKPAVPPPPVSGAAVGKAELAGADVCDGAGVFACVGLAVAELEAGDEAADEAGACGELDAEAPPRPGADVLADDPPDGREDPPAGDGVRVPWWLDECPFVWGAGAETDGTEEPPPPEQAETATARRTAPAAERPAISHAPGAAPGGVRRIFMYPPRMRIR
jgi:hypothetical protein